MTEKRRWNEIDEQQPRRGVGTTDFTDEKPDQIQTKNALFFICVISAIRG